MREEVTAQPGYLGKPTVSFAFHGHRSSHH
jgi:hypothetical protein